MKVPYRSVFNSMPSTPTQDYSPTDFLLSGGRIWVVFVTGSVSGGFAEVTTGLRLGDVVLTFSGVGQKLTII